MAIATANEVFGIVAPDGSLVGELPRGIRDRDLLEMYRWMFTIRTFDGRMVNLQRQGRIAFYGPTTGQEAATVGSGHALGPGDWVAPALREQGIALMRGLPLSTYVAQLIGNADDLCRGRQLPCHPTWKAGGYISMSSCIATQIPHAVGIAMAMKIKKSGAVCLGFMGDGATSEGDFHVAMNFAAVFKAPVVFLCQNNHWAITVPSRTQSATETFAEKAAAYGMPGVRVDGNDCIAVHEATRRACERARALEGPTFIEAVTYRVLAHSTSDDPARYRDPEEVEPWKAKDPIVRMRRFLEARGTWDEAKERDLERRTRESIDEAIAKGEAAGPPELSTLFDDVFERPTPELERQRRELLSTKPVPARAKDQD